MQSNGLMYYDCQQVIKNLLFVAKVIYLISPESDLEENRKEERVNDAVEKTEEEDGDEEEEQQQQQVLDEQDENRPPSLLWVIKKLSLLAKREAANTPKVPVKVSY